MGPPPESRIRFDWTINVSAVVQLLLLLMVLVGGYVNLSNRMTSLETKVSVMFTWWQNAVIDGKAAK